jgi:hypothetical protein
MQKQRLFCRQYSSGENIFKNHNIGPCCRTHLKNIAKRLPKAASPCWLGVKELDDTKTKTRKKSF